MTQGQGRESQLTIKAGIVISLVASLVVGAITLAVNHERRITVVETQQISVGASLSEIKTTLCEISKDLKEHQRQTSGSGR